MENGTRKIKLIRRRLESATDYQKTIGINPPPMGYIYEFEKAQKQLSLFLKLNLEDYDHVHLLRRVLNFEAELFGLMRIGGKRRYYEEQIKLRVLAEKSAMILDESDWSTFNTFARQMTISFHFGRPLLIAPSFLHLMYFQLAMQKSSEQFIEREQSSTKLPENCDKCPIENCPSYRSSDLYDRIPDDCPLLNDSTIRIRQNLIEDVNLSLALRQRRAGLTKTEAQVSTLRAQSKTPSEIADILKKDRGQVSRLLQNAAKKLES